MIELKQHETRLQYITRSTDYVTYCYTMLLLVEFDEYYTSLRPRMNDHNCNSSSGINLLRADNQNLIVNCRNVWFREFWSQHHKCSFNNNNNDNINKQCTGTESIKDYEQEGLVPFVGKY